MAGVSASYWPGGFRGCRCKTVIGEGGEVNRNSRKTGLQKSRVDRLSIKLKKSRTALSQQFTQCGSRSNVMPDRQRVLERVPRSIQIPSQRQGCCKQVMNIVQLRIDRACVPQAFCGLVEVTQEEMTQT